MVKIINLLFALIAYVCVATVITLSLGIGYMWHTDKLNDDKVFRLVALLQDVDLQQISKSHTAADDTVPPEEPSLDEMMKYRKIQDRNWEVKLLALQQGRQEYDHRLQELKVRTDRYDRLAQDWQNKLKKQEELTTQENLAKVVTQIEQIKPDKGKALLMLWLDEGRIDDAILLMSKMTDSKLRNILKTFETDQELSQLHEIHKRIISGGGSKQLQNAIDDVAPTASQARSATGTQASSP